MLLCIYCKSLLINNQTEMIYYFLSQLAGRKHDIIPIMYTEERQDQALSYLAHDKLTYIAFIFLLL